MEIHIIMSMVFSAVLIMILSFIGPEHSENRFWQTVQKAGHILDQICWWFFNLSAVLAGGGLVFVIIREMIRKHSSAGTVCMVILLSLAVILSLRSLIKEHQRGELCECTGDFGHCRIQCMSNPNYYGLNTKGKETQQ